LITDHTRSAAGDGEEERVAQIDVRRLDNGILGLTYVPAAR
jgi:hypothetical protein